MFITYQSLMYKKFMQLWNMRFSLSSCDEHLQSKKMRKTPLKDMVTFMVNHRIVIATPWIRGFKIAKTQC